MTGEELKLLRTKMDMSQQEFAGFIGKSISSVRDWEQGRTRICNLVAKGILVTLKPYLGDGENVGSVRMDINR